MPQLKCQTIRDWKKYGLIYDDYNELYEVYIKTMNCQHCNKEFKNSKDRCMDHDHITGLFRSIVCKACNTHDSYIKYPNGYTNEDFRKKHQECQREYRNNNKDKVKEIEKLYRQNNKEKIGKNRKKKITCICGVTINKHSNSEHLKTQKHLNNMDIYMNNVD